MANKKKKKTKKKIFKTGTKPVVKHKRITKNKIKPKGKSKIKAKREHTIKAKPEIKQKIRYKAASRNISKKKNNFFLTFGDIKPDRGRILVLVVSIIFVITGMIFVGVINSLKTEQLVAVSVPVEKNAALKKEIRKLVQGYPIEKMTPYIARQDPKTAAFLIAIAKKESNWGKYKPVLAGKDCYNYWGFRLQAEKMGSGGHTCFDSPREAVETVASRIDELVNEENIDSPNEMIVWKCGYGCQGGVKSPSEQKWIADVNMYYKKLSGYL